MAFNIKGIILVIEFSSKAYIIFISTRCKKSFLKVSASKGLSEQGHEKIASYYNIYYYTEFGKDCLYNSCIILIIYQSF